MKKSELVIGKEYLSNGRQDWNTSTFDAKRIRVMNLETGSWKWQNEHLVPSSLSSAMKGLRVLRLDKKTGEVRGETVVTLASLRGEWEPTFAKVEKHHSDRIEALNAAQAARNARRDRVGIVMAKVRSFLGLTSDYETYGYVQDVYKTDKVMVNVEFLNAMITELDKQGWKYKP